MQQKTCLYIAISFFYLMLPFLCFAESCKPSNGFYSDSPRNASPGQHAVLCQTAAGCLYPGKASFLLQAYLSFGLSVPF